ncbi:MAG: HDOD domain-containing protein [Rhodocyclaceae bacterium]|nr:HDOD domain-containing protein [Rhodocyclaceae bacterium]
MTVLIQREPVLNRHKTITASRLRVHAPSCAAAASELTRLADLWPGSRDVFVSISGCDLAPDLLDWQPPLNVMLEINAARLHEADTMALISDLVCRQIPLCLDDYQNGMALPPQATFRYLLADAGQQIDMSHAPGSALAKGLSDSESFDQAIAHGYAGGTGWFFLQTPRLPSSKLNASHAQIIHLLNLVRNNAEIKDIELALKKDVTLAFKLLRYINSAGFGASSEVSSFKHAVTLMGYDKLNRWLSLLLVNASQDQSAPALMQTAVIRGRFMELIGKHLLAKSQLDNLFIAGAFSVLDILLGTQLDVVLEHLQLPTVITEALLKRSGEIAPLLELAMISETGTVEQMAQQLSALGLTAEQCNSAQIEAVAFADKLQFS